ncbi:hypothetical protein [Pseudoxanthomonas broegbernensis]|uniref:hypothetical protein n=1 Tax=Pseudoxanthomonas broegbernensis TaxID=83619 RepID=UPI0013907526|nr:hypothetical protein [Pseudoxanthomonas broegbernensis]MBB6065804.1 hypothetical protein [Pseudoxanthomonas broegbernensis]
MPRIPRYVVLGRCGRRVAVRVDWSWQAFLLPWAWPLLRRLWWLGGALTACLATAYGLYLIDGGSGALCGLLVVDGGGRVAAGLWTNALHLRQLRRTGWEEVAVVLAISVEDALLTASIRYPEPG